MIAAMFILVEAFMFCVSQFSLTEYVDEVHYFCIVLCFLFALGNYLIRKQKNSNAGFILLGLFFTCIADYFLIVQNQYYTAGVTAFLLTQICYFSYLTLTAAYEGSRQRRMVAMRVGIVCVASVASRCMMKQFSLLFLAVPFYAVFFIGNIIIACREYKKYPLMSLGLILFICCDICVGLANAEQAGIAIPFTEFFQWLIWIFYIPSQVCISFCIYRKRLENNANI